MARPLAVLSALALALGAVPAAAQEGCSIAEADKTWLVDALDQWRLAQREELALGDLPLPDVYAADAACTYVLPAGDAAGMTASQHPQGKVELPQVGEVPLGPISFAFAADGFVMSLPSVWRAAGVESEFGLEKLMTGVLLHEIAHTRQSAMVDSVAAPAAKAAGVPDDELSDDLIQERFAKVKGYVAAFREETATLFAAAAAPDTAGARGLAAHALSQMRARRARWHSGGNAHFAVFDEVFLPMEGVGQWLIYRYFLKADGAGDVAKALKETRRGGRWWSQDEGLALVLVLDRLLPDWRARAFRQDSWGAEQMLAAAVEGQS